MLEEFCTCLCPCNQEKRDVDHVQDGEGGAVPDRLYPGGIPVPNVPGPPPQRQIDYSVQTITYII